MPAKLTIVTSVEGTTTLHRIVSDTKDESEFVKGLIEVLPNELTAMGVTTKESFRDTLGKGYTALGLKFSFGCYGQVSESNDTWAVTLCIMPL
ncbi:hypothetical protein GGF41_001511 [Coemansia sp. RSA 2531]|nr:hypothetical protein GGF41_001511 [Coemansia sp. RSA 2531]